MTRLIIFKEKFANLDGNTTYSCLEIAKTLFSVFNLIYSVSNKKTSQITETYGFTLVRLSVKDRETKHAFHCFSSQTYKCLIYCMWLSQTALPSYETMKHYRLFYNVSARKPWITLDFYWAYLKEYCTEEKTFVLQEEDEKWWPYPSIKRSCTHWLWFTKTTCNV